jgi:hypothetical protein
MSFSLNSKNLGESLISNGNFKQVKEKGKRDLSVMLKRFYFLFFLKDTGIITGFYTHKGI